MVCRMGLVLMVRVVGLAPVLLRRRPRAVYSVAAIPLHLLDICHFCVVAYICTSLSFLAVCPCLVLELLISIYISPVDSLTLVWTAQLKNYLLVLQVFDKVSAQTFPVCFVPYVRSSGMREPWRQSVKPSYDHARFWN